MRIAACLPRCSRRQSSHTDSDPAPRAVAYRACASWSRLIWVTRACAIRIRTVNCVCSHAVIRCRMSGSRDVTAPMCCTYTSVGATPLCSSHQRPWLLHRGHHRSQSTVLARTTANRHQVASVCFYASGTTGDLDAQEEARPRVGRQKIGCSRSRECPGNSTNCRSLLHSARRRDGQGTNRSHSGMGTHSR